MSLRFQPGAGLIVVPARLHGPTGDVVLRLALDTGATATVVSWDALVLVGYDPAASGARVQITTGSGVEFAPRVTVQRIEALEQDYRDLHVLCLTLPPSATVDGVLGLDFFGAKRLVVDFRSGLVTVD